MKNLFISSLMVLTTIGLVGCASHSNKNALKAEVKLLSKSGSKVKGQIELEDHYGGVIFTGKVSGLKPNSLHGIHVHEKGDCSARDAKSAGEHFSSADHQHGDLNAKGSHEGDLGNIQADKDGNAVLSFHVKHLTLKAGDNSIAGRALVLHADADDLKTQPSGNSGKRIACGVVELVKSKCCGDKENCNLKDKGCDKCKGKGDCADCKKKMKKS